MKTEVTNKLLLLKLIAIAKKLNAQKLNHLVFILENEGRKERKLTFNYEFIMWNIEPYSDRLENDLEQLLVEQMVRNDHGVSLTEKGKAYIQQHERFYEQNKTETFFKFYLYIYQEYPLYHLVDYIYRKYNLGIHEDKDIILESNDSFDPGEKSCMEKTKRKINLAYEELERNDERYMKKIQLIMREIKNENKENVE